MDSLQAIFRRSFAEYAQSRRLHVRELRAATAIMRCRTPELGGRVLVCEQGHVTCTQFNSCGHRSCPRCAEAPRQRWVDTELRRLLPCEHYHAVFTLPHVFLPLWEHNRAWINAQLFDCARRALLELCADHRHLGARPGLLMALHSWGRDLSRHPHVHCLVTAGGLDDQGQWQECRRNYLVPVKALAALFRGKLLHELSQAVRQQRLHLPEQMPQAYWESQIRRQYRTHWNVHLKDRYEHGRGVALYLARYVKGGPLAKSRPLHRRGDHVQLTYTDHRDGRTKCANWTALHFIERVLWHAAPRGQHLVRHCGLYAVAARPHHGLAMKQLRPQAMPETVQPLAANVRPKFQCPQCALPLRAVQSLLPTHRCGEFSNDQPSCTDRVAWPNPQFERTSPANTTQALRRRSLRRRIPLN